MTFRTLDIGGDKVVPYFRSQEEENPALGWRAIRLSLDRPGLLRTQLRALLKAASGAELKMMLPMVTEVSEIRAVRELMQKEIQHISKVESCDTETPVACATFSRVLPASRRSRRIRVPGRTSAESSSASPVSSSTSRIASPKVSRIAAGLSPLSLLSQAILLRRSMSARS